MQFTEFPKMARLSREIVITEKIDGTNAAVAIEQLPANAWTTGEGPDVELDPMATTHVDGFAIYAQSRSRIIVPGDDNFGFAAWVRENAADLVKLGPGIHFGEWWGQGIQRKYGLTEKRFSLFNVHRWGESRPACCHVVPTLYRGDFDTARINSTLTLLGATGSAAVAGFMNPEGIVIFHTAANLCFKKTLHKDEVPKALAKAA